MGSSPRKISGSRAAGILGVSKYSTIIDVWLEIKEEMNPEFCKNNGYKLPERKESNYINFGLAFEDEIINLCEKKQNKEIINKESLYIHKDYDFITCHLDGLYNNFKDYHNVILPTIHEGKTTNIQVFKKEWDESKNIIPEGYYFQLQHQMLVSGYNKSIISVLIFPIGADDIPVELEKIDIKKWVSVINEMGLFKQFEIESDLNLQDMMLDAYIDFWETNIIGGKEPSVLYSDKDGKNHYRYEDILKLIPRPNGSVLANAEIIHLVNTYNDILEEEKRVKIIKDDIRSRLLLYMRTANKELDDCSIGKYLLFNEEGRKIASYNGKTMRIN